MSEPLVEVRRGPLVEAVHAGDAVVVDGSGTIRGSVGDSRTVTFWRSAAKPFQSMPLVYTGAADRWGLSEEELAVTCSSHSGEPRHTELVRSLLDRRGHGPDALACGAHPPLHREAAQELQCRGEKPNPLHSNCSGLHAGMLLLTRHLDAPTTGYQDPEHPVQQEILRNVSRFCGLDAAEIAIAIDGCNAPTYGIPLEAMALAYARLSSPEWMPEPVRTAAVRVREAMTTHPRIVAGTGRFDTDLMSVTQGHLIAKGGASGVSCVATAEGLGIAVKIADGASGPASPGRPTEVTSMAILRQLGVLDDAELAELADRSRPVVRSVTGDPVGEARPVFTLASAGG